MPLIDALPSMASWRSLHCDDYDVLQRSLADTTKVTLTVLLAFLGVEVVLQETVTKAFAFLAILYIVALRWSFTGLGRTEFERRVNIVTYPVFIILSALPDIAVSVLTCVSVLRCFASRKLAVVTIVSAFLPLFAPYVGIIWQFIWVLVRRTRRGAFASPAPAVERSVAQG